ncbi:hypothetical protein MBLNU13_g02145t1 [Cladosporium sp. NU13]
MDIEANNEDLRDFFDSDPDSGSPLMFAIYHKNVAAVQKLIDRGANVKFQGPVNQAIGDYFYFRGFLPVLAPLLDAGADADHAFRYAVFGNNVDAAKVCLERGADPTHTLEKLQRSTKRGAREISGPEGEENRREAEAEDEDEDEEQEAENEEEAENRNRMRNFLETISKAAPSMA